MRIGFVVLFSVGLFVGVLSILLFLRCLLFVLFFLVLFFFDLLCCCVVVLLSVWEVV